MPFEDNAVALVRFENRSLGQIEAGWSNHGGMDVRTEIYGEDGLIHIDATHGVPIKAFSLHSMGYVQEKADSDTGWTYPSPTKPGNTATTARCTTSSAAWKTAPPPPKTSKTATSPTPSSTPPTAAPNPANGNPWTCRG